MSLIDRLRDLLRAETSDQSILSLARQLGTSRNTLSGWFNGSCNPPLYLIDNAAEYLERRGVLVVHIRKQQTAADLRARQQAERRVPKVPTAPGARTDAVTMQGGYAGIRLG